MATAWQHSFHIDQTEVGFLSSSFFYGYLLVQIPAGFFFDALGIKKVIRAAMSLFILGLILFALAPSFYLALLGRLMMGCGAGFAFVGMVYTVSAWFAPALLTLLVGLGEMISMFLSAGGQAISPYLILVYDWRTVLLGLVVVGCIFWAIVFRYLQNSPHHKKIEMKIWPLFKSHWQEVVRNPSVWLAGLYCCGMFGVITIFTSLWGNPYLQARYHLSYVDASHLIALVPFGFGLGSPVLGAINERFIPHRWLIILLAFLLLACTLVMMNWGENPLILALSLFLMGFLGGGNVIAFYIAERSVAPPIRGLAIGLCNAITISAGIIFQPFIGLAWPHFGTRAMWLFPAVIALSCAMTLIYKNRHFS